jgi:hypothetical protein
MKVHILSLQRTGSKSLLSAIHNALEAPLHFKDVTGARTPLGEYFHAWEAHGYKFSQRSHAPYVDEVVFRTAANYKAYKGVNFIATSGDVDSLAWANYHHLEHLTAEHINYLGVLLSLYSDSNYVVKTQIATLAEDCIDTLHTWLPSVLDGYDLTINLVPADIVKWVCSNYACDVTGVFVPCAAQDKARASLNENKMTMPLEYIRRIMSRLREHRGLVANAKNVWTITTDDLSKPEFVAALSARLGAPVTIEHPKEFSAQGYEEMFSNYADIVHDVTEFGNLDRSLDFPSYTYLT